MPTNHREALRSIRDFADLVRFMRDEMGWPIETDDFEALTFDYTPAELGIDSANAAKIEEIKRLRPLSAGQPWGVFFIRFERKRLPVVALRRILCRVVVRKRATARSDERPAWEMHDLLFVTSYGGDDERRLCLAHFAEDRETGNLAALNVLGWDGEDTVLHLADVADKLTKDLAWPDDERNVDAWRERWRSAFTLRHREVITTSKRLAERLAELARAIRARANAALAIESDQGPMRRLLKGFRESLIHDLSEDDFADMHAQTIAYGLLSARVSRESGALVADDAALMLPVTNPFLKELMETFLNLGNRQASGDGPALDFDELGVNEVVETLRAANMEAVLRDFGDRNPQEDPVIHFYELFLKEYDPKKRMQRGVFYTPRPVVSYIVRSVDELLRTEFGLADGLADTTTWGEMAERHKDLKIPEGVSPDQDFVQILDPACGTGTFLVEVIELIYKTLVGKWTAQGRAHHNIDGLWNAYVPRHLLARLHGYELLMAPYAIAHLKIGLKLCETGYRFGSDERARVYLTNALEPAGTRQLVLDFLPALAHEAEAVNEVKRQGRFTVFLGNPPYAKLSSNRYASAEALVAPFKSAVRDERNIQPLSDDYVKFLGLAFATSSRVPLFMFGMITNRGYLSGLIHRGLRQVLVESWRRHWILDLHGDSNVGERAPDGSANDNVFDIQQGVAITLAVKGGSPPTAVLRDDLWGTRAEKQARLATTVVADTMWCKCMPQSPHYSFALPGSLPEATERAFSLTAAMPVTNTGLKTHRDGLVIDFDGDVLLERIQRFADVKRSDPSVREEFFGLEAKGRYQPGDNRDWSMPDARKKLQGERRTLGEYLREIEYRPFDRRVVFYSPAVIDFPREDLMRHMEGGDNLGLIATRQVPNGPFCHVFVSRRCVEMKTASHDRGTNLFPLWIRRDVTSLSIDAKRQSNFSETFLDALATTLNLSQHHTKTFAEELVPDEVLAYIYAVLHSPSYRDRYADSLRIDFPHIPLPGGAGVFRALARIGGELTALHLLESPMLDRPIAAFVGGRNPEVEKVSWSRNTVWLDKAQTTGFKGVREEVWDFPIGGYQVCQKWLKDRKGRTLSEDDIAHYHKIVVALSETIRLMTEIDEVIEAHGGWPGAFAAK